MSKMLSRLWDDDQGVVISVELILVIGILIFGIIPGLVALRNSVIAAMTTIGNVIGSITPSFTFSGFLVGGQANGPIVAVVQGYQLDASTTNRLTGTQRAPIVLPALVVVPPAP
jgi:Flp pilus assembly pilin Flp